MRRLTILLAAAAALMLVSAAQASAAPKLKVNIIGLEGGGGGVVSPSEIAPFPGTPPIACFLPEGEGSEQEGVCENEMEEIEPGAFAVSLARVIEAESGAPNSEFLEWEFVSGLPVGGCAPGESWCIAATEGEDVEVNAIFACKEGEECVGEEPPVEGPELTVAKEGTGSGTVVSSPAGIECGATCSSTAFEEGSKVTLTASPSAGSLFVSWKGCEKGGVNGRQCTVTMDKAKTVNAKFITAYDVTVNRVGSGLGKVSSSPGGVLCLSNCSSTTAAFKEGTSVTLNAAPSKNFVFTEWTGDCSGASLTCPLGSLGEDKEVGAKFTEVAKQLLTVSKSGGGQGTAKSNVAGINCGATCSTMASAYYQGTVVELTATPGKGSAFGGWSGSGCSGTGTCTVTMSAAKEVTAEFK